MLLTLKHYASPEFWACYRTLPQTIQELANQKFSLLKANSAHPSLAFKKIGGFRSARVGLHYRVLGIDVPEGVLWFWIGSHADYDKLIR